MVPSQSASKGSSLTPAFEATDWSFSAPIFCDFLEADDHYTTIFWDSLEADLSLHNDIVWKPIITTQRYFAMFWKPIITTQRYCWTPSKIRKLYMDFRLWFCITFLFKNSTFSICPNILRFSGSRRSLHNDILGFSGSRLSLHNDILGFSGSRLSLNDTSAPQEMLRPKSQIYILLLLHCLACVCYVCVSLLLLLFFFCV